MTVALAVGAICLWVAAAWKAFQLARAPHDETLRWLVLVFASFAISTTMLAVGDAVAPWLDPVLGPNAMRLVASLPGVLTVDAVLAFLFTVAGSASRWQRAWLAHLPSAAVAVAMLAGWYATPGPGRYEPYTDLGQPSLVVFYVSAMVLFAYASATFVTTALRYARRVEDALTALGLRVAAGGMIVFLLLSPVLRFVTIVLSAVGARLPPSSTTLSYLGNALGVSLLAVGLSLPGMRRRARALSLLASHRRRYRELEPLWSRLAAELPYATFGPDVPPWRERWSPRRVHHRFYRRVVECRDGLVTLGPYLADGGPATPEQEARMVDEALARFRAGERPAAAPGPMIAVPEGDDVEADAAALCRLAALLPTTPSSRRPTPA